MTRRSNSRNVFDFHRNGRLARLFGRRRIAKSVHQAAAAVAFEDLEARRLLSSTMQTLNFPQSGVTYMDLNTTDWSDTQTITQFNPSMGTLGEVDISYSGSMNTRIKVENTSTSSGNTITSSVTGQERVDGLGIGSNVLVTNVMDMHIDSFPVFDNDPADNFLDPPTDSMPNPFGADFAGASGKTYNPVSQSGGNTIMITNPAILAAFTGLGTVPYSMNALAMSQAMDSAGNFASDINTTATGTITVTYIFNGAPPLVITTNVGVMNPPNTPPAPCDDNYYPNTTSDPLTSVAFNESEMLEAISPNDGTTLDISSGTIKVWISDEAAPALGVRQVTTKTSGGTTTQNYNVTPMGSSPSSAHNPQTGAAYTPPPMPVTESSHQLSLQGATDTSGRPMMPSLFVTDITGMDPNSLAAHAGDWQYGGTPIAPTDIFGAWKAFTKSIDMTTGTETLTADPNPSVKNGWNLGPGSDAPPAGTPNVGFGLEARWDISSLGLLPGHQYRFYVIVHDGDQNKSGGDSGQACVDALMPGPGPVVMPGPATLGNGAALVDSATLAGGINPTGTITFRLYAPTDILFLNPVFTNTVPVNGDGVYHTSAGYVPTVTGTYQWIATYNGDAHNPSVNSGQGEEPEVVNPPQPNITTIVGVSTPTNTPPAPCNDSYYPNTTTDPLTNVAFNEDSMLKAISPQDGTVIDLSSGTIKVWFSDEHALALGVRQVTTITSGGTTTQPYTVTPMGAGPSTAHNPQVGAPYTAPSQPVTATPQQLALQGGTDTSGRPLFPSLFVTDITGLDPNSVDAHAGDWQYGGTPIIPDDIFGEWKAFTKTVNLTTNTASLTADADPAVKNGWNLGAGSDAPPAGTVNEGYGLEARWNISALGLIPGHSYRFYVIVHDGDQNKSGGDAGQACADALVPSANGNGTTITAPPAVLGNGGKLVDSAILTGGNHPTGNIIFQLFAPSDVNYLNPVFTQTVPVNGDGIYNVTGGYTPTTTGTYQWIAFYSGDANNAPVNSGKGNEPEQVNLPAPAVSTTAGLFNTVPISCDDNYYPNSTNDPLTSVTFNEDSMLTAMTPSDGSVIDLSNGTIKVWYTDEHAMALGVRQVTTKTSSGTTTQTFSVTPMGSNNPSMAHNPLTGAPYTPPPQPVTATPQQLALEGSTDTSGRPLFPSLYVTDITGLDINTDDAHAGDWQYGGTPIRPNDIFGTWKAFTKMIDMTTATPTITLTADPDPAKNNLNLGAGADAPPTSAANLGFTSEVRWNISSLGLIPGHSYRFYVIVHDGDQNKAGGDSGQACANALDPSAPGATPVFTVGGSSTLGDGSMLGDSATLFAGNNPTGTITFQLFGPSDVNYSNPLFTQVVPVNGNGTYTTPNGYTPTAAGTYQWLATYSGDANNASVTSGKGSEPETVNARPGDVDPTVTADSATVTAGGQVGFTVKLKSEMISNAVVLTDALPSGAGHDIIWTIDPSVGNPSSFQITGPVGNQNLSLVGSPNMTSGQILTVHVIGTTTANDAGTISNTASVMPNPENDGHPSTASITINPAPVLGPISSPGPVISGNTLKYTITNNTASPVTLMWLQLAFPTGNGNLTKITSGSTTIFNTAMAGPNVLISGWLANTTAARTILPGQSITLTFTFSKTAAIDPSKYKLHLDFGNNIALNV